MINRFYDKDRFRHILTYLETNPTFAKQELEEYVEKFPRDYSARPYYAYVLIILGMFKEAESVLDTLELETIGVKSNRGNIEKNIKNRNDLIITKLNLLARQEKYQELYDYYQNHYRIIKTMDEEEKDNIAPLMFHCRKQLGMVDTSRREGHSYLFRQIVNYEEEDFLAHIQKHLAKYNTNVEEPNPCIFDPDFPVNDILSEIKKLIPSEGDNRLYYNFYVTIYVFKYNNCGKVNGKSTNYFKIVCFQNTNNIITMYPDTDCHSLPYTDLNYMAIDYSSPKVKTLTRTSQIDKFNKRFGLK